jgi:hypothetical protein
MNEIKVSINCNGLLSKKITFKILITNTIDFNKHVHDIRKGKKHLIKYIRLHIIVKCDHTNVVSVPSIEGSRWRAIRAKKSPCEG